MCERGNMFGYQDLVFDPRNLVWLRAAQCPVSMDLTHTLQQPAAGQNQVGSELAQQLPMLPLSADHVQRQPSAAGNTACSGC